MNDCHPSTTVAAPNTAALETGLPLIALAGQPNMGKSTLFNFLTGLNQHVGNWPGKTIERKEGVFTRGEQSYRLVDLPGTYSLTANSPEEVIAREYIIREKPDLVLAVVSAANLERSLYLVAELLALPGPLVVALNMMDVAAQEGMRIDPGVLEKALGVPVIPITATRAEGINELFSVVQDTLAGRRISTPRLPEIRADHRALLADITTLIGESVPQPYPAEWVALKLLEGDAEVTGMLKAVLPQIRWQQTQSLLAQHDDAFLAVASGRYEWIGDMLKSAVERPRLGQISVTERLDRWAAHPFWGLLILAGVLGFIFWLTFTIGAPLQNWLDLEIVTRSADTLRGVLGAAPSWMVSLLSDGVIGGVGSVLTFLPVMIIFFASFAILEDVGYMARAAYVMDNLMHLMGLHGKSFLPLFLGFGCNVPSILGTRVIDSRPARLLTILIAPLVPCTARMAVVAFLAPAFFGANALFISWGLVLFSLLALVLSGMLLNRTIFKGERSAFIMEMPLYHQPNARTIGLLIWQRSLSFIAKAGTTILAMSLAVWALSTLPGGNLESSYMVQFGHWIEPLGKFVGLDWRLTVALITSFPAKENAIATLGVLFGSAQGASLTDAIESAFPLPSALSFLVINMLFIPCMATVAVIRQETGSWGWTLLNIGLMLGVSLGAGAGVYHLARLLGL